MNYEELDAHLSKCSEDMKKRLRSMGRPVLDSHETSKSYKSKSRKDDAFCSREKGDKNEIS